MSSKKFLETEAPRTSSGLRPPVRVSRLGTTGDRCIGDERRTELRLGVTGFARNEMNAASAEAATDRVVECGQPTRYHRDGRPCSGIGPLVADQDPKAIEGQLRTFLEQHVPEGVTWSLHLHGSGPGSTMDRTSLYMKAAGDALEAVYGK